MNLVRQTTFKQTRIYSKSTCYCSFFSQLKVFISSICVFTLPSFFKWVEINTKKIQRQHILMRDKLTVNKPDSHQCIALYLTIKVNYFMVFPQVLVIFQKFVDSITLTLQIYKRYNLNLWYVVSIMLLELQKSLWKRCKN